MKDVERWFKDSLKNKVIVEKLKKIRFIVTDVDGCLTDAQILYTSVGHQGKFFSVQDGFAIRRVLETGIKIAFLSGRRDGLSEKRASELGIPPELCLVGFCNGKKEKLGELIKITGFKKEEVAFFGEDFLDLDCFEMVGLAVSPANALFYVAAYADLIVPVRGGENSFRSFLDLLLFVQGKHFAQKYIEKVIAE